MGTQGLAREEVRKMANRRAVVMAAVSLPPSNGRWQGSVVVARNLRAPQKPVKIRLAEGVEAVALPALEGEGVAFRLPTMGWRSAAALVLAFLLKKQEGRLEVALRMEKSILGLGSGDAPLDQAVAGAVALILQALGEKRLVLLPIAPAAFDPLLEEVAGRVGCAVEELIPAPRKAAQ
jgi:hypothetical protein